MSRWHRVLSSLKSNSHIYQSLTMNWRHRAKCSLNLSSHPLLRDPSLNPHLDSLSTPNWLQLLNPLVSQPVTSTRLGVHPTHTTLCSKLHLHPYKTTAIPRQRNLTSSQGRIRGNSDHSFPCALCTSTTSPSSSKMIVNKSPMLPCSCQKSLYSGGNLT